MEHLHEGNSWCLQKRKKKCENDIKACWLNIKVAYFILISCHNWLNSIGCSIPSLHKRLYLNITCTIWHACLSPALIQDSNVIICRSCLSISYSDTNCTKALDSYKSVCAIAYLSNVYVLQCISIDDTVSTTAVLFVTLLSWHISIPR